jgi:hypothetical protein
MQTEAETGKGMYGFIGCSKMDSFKAPSAIRL